MIIAVATEDNLSEAVILRLLREFGPRESKIQPFGQTGAGDLKRNVEKYISIARSYPVLLVVARRKRRERAVGARESVKRIEKTLKTSSGLDRIGVRVKPGRRPDQEPDDD